MSQYRYGKKANKIPTLSPMTSSKDLVRDVILVSHNDEQVRSIRTSLDDLEETFEVAVGKLEHQISFLRETLENFDVV